MSLQPQVCYMVPDETARVARAAFPKGNPYMRMRDELGAMYDDQQFAPLFAVQGQPAESPTRLALTLVFQFAEGLSDRQAADAVRSRIDWKYALGLALTDPGFDASVLSEFRTRILAGGLEQTLLDTMLTLFRERGLLKARGKQRTDSTHVLAAIHGLNRLECVGETLRHALNQLAVVAPDWLRTQVGPDWVDRYGVRFDNFRLPKADTERAHLAATIGADGFHLLRAIVTVDAPAWLREVPAVDILRRVWLQQYYAPAADGTTCWRDGADLPPGALLINSPYDPEARYSTKRSVAWTGYKVHLTETCDEDAPHLITHVETTAATTTDEQAVAPIHAALAEKDLLPADHIVDAGYVDSERLVTSQADHGVNLLGPIPSAPGWQARAGQGFDVTCFAVDWEQQTARCPAGTTSTEWKPTRDRHGKDVIHIEFDRQLCRTCVQRPACTRSQTTGRELTIRPQAQHSALLAARERQTTEEFKEQYAARSGIEGTISEGVHRCSLRRTRYIGIARTHLQHILTAVGINVQRIAAWFADRPRATTRRSQFVILMQGTG